MFGGLKLYFYLLLLCTALQLPMAHVKKKIIFKHDNDLLRCRMRTTASCEMIFQVFVQFCSCMRLGCYTPVFKKKLLYITLTELSDCLGPLRFPQKSDARLSASHRRGSRFGCKCRIICSMVIFHFVHAA